jgi:hypothetical protein
MVFTGSAGVSPAGFCRYRQLPETAFAAFVALLLIARFLNTTAGEDARAPNETLFSKQLFTHLRRTQAHENYGAGFQPLFSFLTFSWGVAPG